MELGWGLLFHRVLRSRNGSLICDAVWSWGEGGVACFICGLEIIIFLMNLFY